MQQDLVIDFFKAVELRYFFAQLLLQLVFGRSLNRIFLNLNRQDLIFSIRKLLVEEIVYQFLLVIESGYWKRLQFVQLSVGHNISPTFRICFGGFRL
ncbi:hypothetical protein D3C86_1945440 [compost metagenome]